MFTRTVKETVKEYDKDGKIVKETVTETTENSDSPGGRLVWDPNSIVYASRHISPEFSCDTSKHVEGDLKWSV